MSDPIADIIHNWYMKGGTNIELAKQIRQQIGRELLGKEQKQTEYGINNAWDWEYVLSSHIREICQLEEDK